MTDRDKALEIANNLNRTINKYGNNTVEGSGIVRNSIFSTPRPSKSLLQNKLDRICKRHGINKDELKNG